MSCKHGMVEAFCSLCTPTPKSTPRKPSHRSIATNYGSRAVLPNDAPVLGYALIRIREGKQGYSFTNLNENTKIVHIDGHLFVWALEKILSLAPNLKTIRVIPSAYNKLGSLHHELCRGRGVEFITGHHSPEMAWDEGEVRSPHYEQQTQFMRNLSGEQKQLFDELLLFGFQAAEIVSRYFCLKGEPYKPQRLLALEYGYAERLNSYISQSLGAVFFYLDPSFVVGAGAVIQAGAIRQRVERLRLGVKGTRSLVEIRSSLQAKLGVSKLPDNLWPARFALFEQVHLAREDGRVSKLKKKRPREYRVLSLRLGLEDNRCQTLEVIGTQMGLTRERVRQIENDALVYLGIVVEEESM